MDFAKFHQFATELDKNVTDEKIKNNSPKYLGIFLIFFLMLSIPANPYIGLTNGGTIPVAFGETLLPVGDFLQSSERHEKATIEKWLNRVTITPAEGSQFQVETTFYKFNTEKIPFIHNSTTPLFYTEDNIDNTDPENPILLNKKGELVNPSRQEFVEYEIVNTANEFILESAQFPMKFNKSDCTLTIYNQGEKIWNGTDIVATPFIGKEYWTVARSSDGGSNWNLIDATAFDCNIKNIFKDANNVGLTYDRQHALGNFTNTIDKIIGGSLEQSEWFEHFNPAWDGQLFSFVEIWEDVVLSEITGFNSTKIDSFLGNAGATFTKDRTEISSDTIQFIKNTPFVFDFAKIKDDFDHIKVTSNGDGTADIEFWFNKNPTQLNQNDVMFQDPTYGYSVADITYRTEVTINSTEACTDSTTYGSVTTPTSSREISITESGTTGTCVVYAIKHDTTPIPDSADITDVGVRWDVDISTNSRHCDFRPMEFDPSTLDGEQMYKDIHNGTKYVDQTAGCLGVGDDKFNFFTVQADTHLENLLTQDYFAYGWHFDSETRGIITIMGFDDPELQVTFTLPEPQPESSTSYIFDETLTQYNFTLSSIDSLYALTTIGQTILKDGYYPPYSITIPPISHITFDNTGDTNPVDFGSRGGTTTNTGSVVYQASPLGHAKSFDGIDDYIEFSNEADFDFERTDAFTYSWWSKMGEITNVVLFDKGSRTGTLPQLGFSIHILTLPTTLNFQLVNSDNVNELRERYNVTADGCEMQDGGWHHFVQTYDGTSLVTGAKLYCDGVEMTDVSEITDTLTATILNNLPLRLGVNDIGGNDFTGVIDDVRIYDYFLTSAQALDLYNYEYQNKYKYPDESDLAGTSNLVGYWSLDNSLHDYSRNGKDMKTIAGTELYVDSDFGRALTLDGVNYFQNATDIGSSYEFEHSDAFSVCMWYMDSDLADDNDFLIGKETATVGVKGWGIWRGTDAENNVKFQLQDGTTSFTVSSATFTSDVWHNICATYDGTSNRDGMTIYIDGANPVSPASLAISVSIVNDEPLTFGATSSGAKINQASLDEVRIYNDELTASEVLAIYNMADYSESNTISIIDTNTLQPFYANYTGITITSIGISANNLQVYSAPAPDTPTITATSTLTTVTLTPTEVTEYGTVHGSYVQILNPTDSLYYDTNLYGSNYVPLPIAHWKFDGKETGRTNYGTGDISILESFDFDTSDGDDTEIYISGTIGSALRFDQKSYLKVIDEDESIFDREVSDAWSVSVWVDNLTTGASFNAIFAKVDVGALVQDHIGYECNMISAPTQEYVQVRFVSDGPKAYNQMAVRTPLTTGTGVFDGVPLNVGKGNPHHIVCTYNGGGAWTDVNIYIDGVDQFLTNRFDTTITGAILNDEPPYIGSFLGGSKLRGSLDDLRYYDFVLTQSHVDSLYAASSPQIDSNPYKQELLHLKFNLNQYDSAHGYNTEIFDNDSVNEGTITYITGKIGDGIDFFDGLNDYWLQINDESAFDFDSDDSWSMCTWIKPELNAIDRIIFMKGNDGDNPYFKFIYNGAEKVQLQMQLSNADRLEVTGNTALTTGSWNHLCVTYDGTKVSSGITIYKNDSTMILTVNDETIAGSMLNDIIFAIGSKPNTQDARLSSIVDLDDFRFYDFELTSGNVSTLYNSGSGTESPLGVTIDATPSITVSNLAGTTSFTFRVASINGAGQSDWQEIVKSLSGGSRGGAGGGGDIISEVGDNLITLSFLPNTHIMTTSDFASGTIPVTWDNGQQLRIQSLTWTEDLDSIKFTIEDALPLTLLPLGLSDEFSTNEIEYSISTPPNICNPNASDPSKRITTNCMQQKLYEVDVTITTIQNGEEQIGIVTIKIDTRLGLGGTSLALISIILMAVMGFAGIIQYTRKHKRDNINHHRKGGKTSHGKTRQHT